MTIRLETALAIAKTALAKGKELRLKPLTVAILDPGGHLVLLLRDDGSSLLRPEIAMGKAWGVLGMGFGGRELARRADKSPQFFSTLAIMSGGRMVPAQGGVIIRDAAGSILGSIGISGDTSIHDEICAVAGIEDAGLVADVG